jgi:predicted nucleic acid-binding protein
VTLYADTSSVVKLYVDESGRDDVRALVQEASIVVTSAVAYPEARAAFARRRREGRLTPKDFSSARKAFESDWVHFVAIPVTAPICQEAGDLAERYKLRGFDSVHLACFAEMLRGLQGEDDVVFSSFDERQSAAARRLARTIR